MYSNDYDIEFIARMKEFEHITQRDIGQWLSEYGNFYYMDKDDIALFNFETPYLYTGHYFFTSRGKAAKKKALEVLDGFFSLFEQEVTIRGLTPVEHKAAKWMNRQLGFKSYGLVETAPNEFCELFVLTRKDFYNG